MFNYNHIQLAQIKLPQSISIHNCTQLTYISSQYNKPSPLLKRLCFSCWSLIYLNRFLVYSIYRSGWWQGLGKSCVEHLVVALKSPHLSEGAVDQIVLDSMEGLWDPSEACNVFTCCGEHTHTLCVFLSVCLSVSHTHTHTHTFRHTHISLSKSKRK